MTWTVVAPLISRDGANVGPSTFSNDPADFWSPIKRKVWTISSTEVRSVQAPTLPLRADHGLAPIGEIHHLERREDGTIGVGELEDVGLLRDRNYYLSVESRYQPSGSGLVGSDITIDGAALCGATAMVGLGPATFLRDGLDHHGKRSTGTKKGLLERATNARRKRRFGQPIIVEGTNTGPNTPTLERTSTRQVEIRSARPGRRKQAACASSTSSSPPPRPRLIHEPGPSYVEVFSHGAFAGCEKDPERVRVNRDHQLPRVIGKASA